MQMAEHDTLPSADALPLTRSGPRGPPRLRGLDAERLRSGAVIADPLGMARTILLDERRTADHGRAGRPRRPARRGRSPALAALAHEVRLAWCGPTVEVEGILSAKTGGCPEDCHFCSQSAQFDTPVQATPVPRHRRGARRRPGDEGPRRDASSASCSPCGAPTSARWTGSSSWCRWCGSETGINVAVSAGILTASRPSASPPSASTATTTTWRRPGSFFGRHRHHPHLGRAVRHLPAGAGPRHGAVLRGAAGHGRDATSSASS